MDSEKQNVNAINSIISSDEYKNSLSTEQDRVDKINATNKAVYDAKLEALAGKSNDSTLIPLPKTKEELESFVKEKKLKKIKWFHSPRAGTIKRVYDDLFRKNTFSTKTGRWFLMTKRDLAWFEKIDERNFKGEYQELFSKIKRDYTAKADIIAILGKKD